MIKQNLNRRHFLGQSVTSASLGLAIGGGLPAAWLRATPRTSLQGERILVVIQLSGGNDGLNTVIPYRHEAYRKARPKLGIPEADVLKIDDELGLHPSLSGASRLIEAGRLSVVQGVGYDSPNRSHFESMDIWHSCQRKAQRGSDGWLGRWIAAESTEATAGDSLGLHLGREQQPLALVGRGVQVPSIASVDQFRLKVADDGLLTESVMQTAPSASGNNDGLLDFLQSSTQAAMQASGRLEKALAAPDAAGDFPETQLGEKLRVISRLILAGLSTKVYYVTLDGFDTHSQQPLAHAGLLRQWSDAVEALVRRLEQADQADRVMVMTFSEFGRRVAENASEGTDHGAAAPLFFAGPRLPSPLVGSHPDLEDLDDGDLKFHTDFRSVYATVLENWFESRSPDVLGGTFPTIRLL